MPRQVVVEVVGDASKLNKATTDAVQGATSLTGKLQGVGKGMVIGAGIASFNLLTNAVDMGISKLGEAAQAFRDNQVSQEKLANSLQNNIPNWNGNTDGAEAFASAQERLGFEDDAVRDSLGQLVGITHDLGKAQTLSALAADLARAKGLDLATATDVVTKAAQGQGRGLKALGIDIGGATDAAGLLAAAQKNVQGAAENWAKTNEGRVAVSNVKVSEAMEKVGAIVENVSQAAIPILADSLTNVVGVLSDVWTAIQPVVKAIAGELEPVFKNVTKTINDLKPVFEAVFAAIGTIIGAAVKLWTTEFDIFKQAVGVVLSVIRGGINAAIGVVNGIINGINSIQIHINLSPPVGPAIKFDWNGMNLGKIAYLHAGGIVPGQPGQDVPAILQAGERVIPAGAGPSVINLNVQVSGSAIFDPYGQAAQQIATALLPGLRRELTRQSMSLA